MSRFELVKSPATVVLQAMIMTAGGSDVVFGGGPTEGGVQGVVGIGATSRGSAADHDAVPVADLDVAA
jgi:hypothetical protein